MMIMYLVHRVHDKTKVQDFLKASSCFSFHVNIVLFSGEKQIKTVHQWWSVSKQVLYYTVYNMQWKVHRNSAGRNIFYGIIPLIKILVRIKILLNILVFKPSSNILTRKKTFAVKGFSIEKKQPSITDFRNH